MKTDTVSEILDSKPHVYIADGPIKLHCICHIINHHHHHPFPCFKESAAKSSFQNHWVFGLRSSSDILETSEHNVSETGSVSVLRCGGKDTYSVGSLRKSKGKAIPVTGREGPYGRETLRLPYFV
jgi:hypothetical protein